MATFRLRYNESPPEAVLGGVVTVGNFDGVHRGHTALLAEARGVGGPVVAVTFDPHPLVLLARARYQPPLTTMADRAELLHEAGADHVVILQTTAELLALSPEYFFETIVAGALRARGMVEGFNFQFGKDRAGSNDTLRHLCAAREIPFVAVPAFTIGERPVSSSRVRDALAAGDCDSATALLGRPYGLTGTVVTGAQRGRTIGFPTANLDRVETLIPGEGVYAVRVAVGRRGYAGAAHVGANATFGESDRRVEVHLLDFNGDLYGQTLWVEFVARLRESRKFESVPALVEQMRLDVAAARRFLGRGLESGIGDE